MAKLKKNIGRLHLMSLGIMVDVTTPSEDCENLVKKYPRLRKYFTNFKSSKDDKTTKESEPNS